MQLCRFRHNFVSYIEFASLGLKQNNNSKWSCKSIRCWYNKLLFKFTYIWCVDLFFRLGRLFAF